ncbi:RNase NYN domain-containing protein [Caenorhabditis elegans]|uniref:RNase NYN domain-containing protein n=1 Tax=Caenorhabditis elegans TaxID=6239 RepID=O45692_CAEEL|nr:RNase NYN domain-containing protein [Caenorhabditis elegans]CAB07641.1 RNase NYN domain-containing protein [Caenorhabditis elegans]|eukprot:NP_493335.1 Uncharacterized protein CELE_M01E5.3 [Caenorhabditis elegans]
MTMVKTLVALATERMLLKTSGPTFLRGIEFMYAAGLAPDRLSVMMTSSHKYVLQFHSKCDIRPFAANYPNFGRVLRGIVHVREWRIKSIEFVNVAFYMRDVDNLERAIEKLGVELVLLRNCTYPGVQRGDEAVKFLSALNRKKQAVVCEYGDDRLKHRIGRRSSGNRTRRASRNGQEIVNPAIAPGAAAAAQPALEAAPAAPAAGAAAPEANAPQAAPPGIRRPIPLNPDQARHIIPQLLNPGGAQPAPVQDGPVRGPPGIINQGRVVVGAHVYEFRAADVPNADGVPAVHNINHLLNVLNENAGNDVRVIVLPSRVGEGLPIHFNNNDLIFRHQSRPQPAPQQAAAAAAAGAAPAVAVGAEPLPQPDDVQIAPIPADERQARYARVQARLGHMMNARMRQNQEDQQYYYDQQPPNLMVVGTAHAHYRRHMNAQAHQQQREPSWNNYAVANAPPAIIQRNLDAPAPMFGVAVNEPQVQRNGDDSNDSTDREEIYDAEQQRQEALRDLVADPEAQPNFAPVEAQAVDLDMLEEEGEDDEVMEVGGVDGQFMMDGRAVME